MPRNMHASEGRRRAQTKRVLALVRKELRGTSEPRVSATSPMSFAVKAEDPAIRAMIDEALRRKAATP